MLTSNNYSNSFFFENAVRSTDLHIRKNDKSFTLTAVVGCQWGDEGKGKLIGLLAPNFDVCCRYNGGNNAGHSLELDGQLISVHILPSGIIERNITNIIGHGTVVHIESLLQELNNLKNKNSNITYNLLISSRAHIVFNGHILIDGKEEDSKLKNQSAIGTTRKGIGPCYASKIERCGIRFSDLIGDWNNFEKKYKSLMENLHTRCNAVVYDPNELEQYKHFATLLRPLIVDTTSWLHTQIDNKQKILIEGANAALLDIDNGTYPWVTSSSTVTGGISSGLGIPPCYIQNVIGVVKAYTTRVGEGPFPTEIKDGEAGEFLRRVGKEFGTTTGRPRRCGWFDVPLVRYALRLNGVQRLFLTKLDVLSGLDSILVCVDYKQRKTSHFIRIDLSLYSDLDEKLPPMTLPITAEEFNDIECIYEQFDGWTENLSTMTDFRSLPDKAKIYLSRLQTLLDCPIDLVGVGPMAHQTIDTTLLL